VPRDVLEAFGRSPLSTIIIQSGKKTLFLAIISTLKAFLRPRLTMARANYSIRAVLTKKSNCEKRMLDKTCGAFTTTLVKKKIIQKQTHT